jgi:alpha-glucoside transport system substrate-binding protein
MFNDTPQARALMQYLVTADAQSIWAERGGYLSANRNVDPEIYPNQLTRQIAQMLSEAPAVRFDASDLMPEAVNNAFWGGILDYVNNPDSLDSVLESIESAAEDAY